MARLFLGAGCVSPTAGGWFHEMARQEPHENQCSTRKRALIRDEGPLFGRATNGGRRRSSGTGQGAGVAALGPIDVGAGLFVAGAVAWAEGAPVGDRVGAPVNRGVEVPVGQLVGTGVEVGSVMVGVVDGCEGAVVVVLSLGRTVGVVGSWTPGFVLAGRLASGMGRTRK
jgi:hypothetical protein